MKRFMQVCVFFFALSALYGQSPAALLPRLDGSLKGLAADISKKLAGQKDGKVAIGQWTYRDGVPVLGVYWAAQLAEELTNIPDRPFILLSGGAAAADWAVSGEIVETAGLVRVYTRLVRRADNSVVAGMHSDFERGAELAEMLAVGGGQRDSSSVMRDAYETDSWENPVTAEIAANGGGALASRTIHVQGDEDFFLLAPDKDGSLVAETTGGTDTYMELYEAASGNKLADNDDGGPSGNARIRHAVRAGVRYIAKVKGYDGETGAYGFRAYMNEPVRMEADEYEPDGDFASAREIPLGTPQQHTFTTADDVDWVKFQVSQPGRYTIRARGLKSTRLDTCIELYGSGRDLIKEDDDGGESLDSRLWAQLQAGTYYLKVTCLDDSPNEPYRITVTAE
ncbi:MAG: DVUA0089 family protein [Spirochaetia bacterium]|nr:DVUA0089 family protein [Spirochaetia bacterium]